jgi:hypothetical protein
MYDNETSESYRQKGVIINIINNKLCIIKLNKPDKDHNAINYLQYFKDLEKC